MLLEFLQAVTGIFVVIYDGQHGLKFTLGRAGSVYPPGRRGVAHSPRTWCVVDPQGLHGKP